MPHHSHHKTAMSHHKTTKPRHNTRKSHDQSLVKSILTAPFKIWGRLVLPSPESSVLQTLITPLFHSFLEEVGHGYYKVRK